MNYAEWIDAYVTEHSERVVGGPNRSAGVRGMCASATDTMVKAFPELRQVRGHYDGIAHWWCVAPDGSIVDPTAEQFLPGGAYVEYHGPDPLGKCMYCGDYVWQNIGAGGSACSVECYNELAAEYGMPPMKEERVNS